MQAFPGSTIASLTQKIRFHKASIKPFSHVIIHVGTNDISRYSVKEFTAAYTNLVSVIRFQSETIHITLSAILPRPVDYFKYGEKIIEVNNRIKSFLVPLLGIHFVHSYKPFVFNRLPIREFFAINDGGLHLNFAGSDKLRKFFVGVVRHLKCK